MKKFIGIHPIQLSERKLQGAKITFIWKSCVPLQISKHHEDHTDSKRQVSATTTTTTKSEEKERNIGTIFHPLQIKLNKKHRLLTFYSHKNEKTPYEQGQQVLLGDFLQKMIRIASPSFLHKLGKINKY